MSFSDATQFRKQQEYQKAIAIYQPLWKENQDQFSEWDGWGFAYCLSKVNRHQEALDICRELYKRFKGFEILRSLYARCIYYTQFMQKSLPELSVLNRAVQGMYDLSPPHTAYSFTPIAIFKLIKIMMSQSQIKWKEIESWLLKMDPDLLNDQPFKITDHKGKERELASQVEQWYANMIKAKAGSNEPQQLLEVLSVARKKKIKWHYNNDIWFARKEAFAYKQLGQKDKAEKILRNIVKKKADWFLIFDLAQVVNDSEEQLQLLCRAAMAGGKPEMKLKLYETIYVKIAGNENLKTEAALHLCLIAALREENGWEVKTEWLAKIEEMKINSSEQGSSVQIIQTLRPFWIKYSGEKEIERHSGIVTTILPNNKAGFIKSKKKSYFFSTHDVKGTVEAGKKVSFELIDSFDKKKNKPSKQAIRIKLKS